MNDSPLRDHELEKLNGYLNYLADNAAISKWIRDSIYAIGAQSHDFAVKAEMRSDPKYMRYVESKSNLNWYIKRGELRAYFLPSFSILGRHDYERSSDRWCGMTGDMDASDVCVASLYQKILVGSGADKDLDAVCRHVESINSLCLGIFSGALTVTKTYCRCQSPMHLFPIGHEVGCSPKHQWWNDTKHIDLEPRYDICALKGDRYFCNQCTEYYERHWPAQIEPAPGELIGLEASERERRQRERAKVTVSVRWAVLARDGFCCRACGRSKLKGDDIILHVDHIRPIAKGGTSDVSNLQTLCADCNLGKSDSDQYQGFLFSDPTSDKT